MPRSRFPQWEDKRSGRKQEPKLNAQRDNSGIWVFGRIIRFCKMQLLQLFLDADRWGVVETRDGEGKMRVGEGSRFGAITPPAHCARSSQAR
jgi:hypothetical protein